VKCAFEAEIMDLLGMKAESAASDAYKAPLEQ
jgi:hypothetical protein